MGNYKYLRLFYSILAVIVITISGLLLFNKARIITKKPIKVGVLHSLTGSLAISELPVVDTTLMAINEINQNGGIMGRMIEPIVIDGKSDPKEFAIQAANLIDNHKVSVIFGCWASTARKMVKEIVESKDHLLFYPTQYEGLEQSSNIVYTGSTPNQQIIPAVKWCLDNLGSRIYLIGTNYLYPKAANEVIKETVKLLGGEIVGEEYIDLGDMRVTPFVDKIISSKPDFILSTINGGTNIAFFKSLRSKGVNSKQIPTMSFSLGEEFTQSDLNQEMEGDYACWSYFESLKSADNLLFISKFKMLYGSERVITDPMIAGYTGVYLWAQAAIAANSVNTSKVRAHLPNQAFNSPGGIVYLDSLNHHTWKFAYIGKINQDGEFDIVWNTVEPIPPKPFPTILKSKQEWVLFLEKLESDSRSSK